MAEANRNLAGNVSGAVDRATTAAGLFSRRTLAWVGVALAAVTLLSVNLVSSTVLRSAKIDLTKEKLFTISDGTRAALRAIDEPIDVRVYFSKKLGELAPNYAKAFERVKTMLDRYRDISRGKLRITYLDPEPFSDAEERAVASGLKGIRLNQEGEMGYFGIYGTNSTDAEANLPFLAIERERFLEYDVTKLIVSLASQRKMTVGLISGIKLEGEPGNPMFGRPPQPGPLMLDHIKEFFTIKSIAKDAKEIPSDIGVLMVVQPEGLSAETAYAVDQFALNGGKVLAFVDPVAETTRQGNQMFMMMQGPPDLSQFGKLLTAWGVSFDTSKVAADKDRARRVQFNSGGGAYVANYVLWLGLKQDNLDQKDVLAGDIKELNFASAGILEKASGATTQFTPLVYTTPNGMKVGSDVASIVPDPKALLREYKAGGTPLTLAARVAGEAKSAFPDGAPKAPPAKDDKSADKADDAKAADKSVDKTAEKTGEKTGEKTDKAADKKATAKAADKAEKKAEVKTAEKKAEPAEKKGVSTEKKVEPAEKKAEPEAPKAEAKPHVASGKVNVVVIADSDFLQDQFWLDVREMMGQQVAMPYAHNGAFVLAALENLTGSDALISLRARGVADRPFEVVADLRREAEARFLASEQALTEKLKQVRTKLAEVQKGSSGEFVLTEPERKEIEKFRAELIETQRELRLVKRELRKDIDRLDGILKFFNIAAVPLLIGIVSVGLAYRRRRPARQAQAAEEMSHGA
jgi:ABC-type uncharacterized transport system involved in gliding motility auxiliary subunit